jgi:di/tricarboxylate transporter
MLGLGMAIETSGLAQLIATGMTQGLGIENPWIMLSLIYLLAAILTEIVSNNAVAVLLTPLAIIIGQALGVSPIPFIIAVMFGSSASFSTPIGYQTNTFIYSAGGYKFGDFFRVGFPLAVILWLVSSFLIPVIWPF